jgi:hypothetical protein
MMAPGYRVGIRGLQETARPEKAGFVANRLDGVLIHRIQKHPRQDPAADRAAERVMDKLIRDLALSDTAAGFR